MARLSSCVATRRWPCSTLRGRRFGRRPRCRNGSSRSTVADASLPLAVGIGLDAGEAVPVDGGYRGGALNLAARLCSLAGPGEVLVSPGVTHFARKVEGLDYVERGAVRLKGLEKPVDVVAVRPEREDVARDLAFRRALDPASTGALEGRNPYKGLRAFGEDDAADFFGREALTEHLVERLARTRFLAVVGPSGSGKSSVSPRRSRAAAPRGRTAGLRTLDGGGNLSRGVSARGARGGASTRRGHHADRIARAARSRTSSDCYGL